MKDFSEEKKHGINGRKLTLKGRNCICRI